MVVIFALLGYGFVAFFGLVDYWWLDYFYGSFLILLMEWAFLFSLCCWTNRVFIGVKFLFWKIAASHTRHIPLFSAFYQYGT